MVTTAQQYIDNVLFPVQCCLGRLGAKLINREGLGYDCDTLKKELIFLSAILNTLIRYDFTADDEDSCLTVAQINELIVVTKKICQECCDIKIIAT